MNIAKNKKIIESNWSLPETLTDGNTTKYEGKTGHAGTTYPDFFTINLEDVFEIKLIRILLWDNDNRQYMFRLLTSTDLHTWNVHFDTNKKGRQSWQNFEFNDKIKVKYIRFHGLWNSRNSFLNVVQVEAYEKSISKSSKEDYHYINTIRKITEISDGLPITKKLVPIVQQLREIAAKHPKLLNQESFFNVAEELENKVYDVQSIEETVDAIKREIVNPINNEMSKSNKIGRISVILGIIGGILAIISIIITILQSNFFATV